jgi:hypothetical protein
MPTEIGIYWHVLAAAVTVITSREIFHHRLNFLKHPLDRFNITRNFFNPSAYIHFKSLNLKECMDNDRKCYANGRSSSTS